MKRKKLKTKTVERRESKRKSRVREISPTSALYNKKLRV